MNPWLQIGLAVNGLYLAVMFRQFGVFPWAGEWQETHFSLMSGAIGSLLNSGKIVMVETVLEVCGKFFLALEMYTGVGFVPVLWALLVLAAFASAYLLISGHKITGGTTVALVVLIAWLVYEAQHVPLIVFSLFMASFMIGAFLIPIGHRNKGALLAIAGSAAFLPLGVIGVIGALVELNRSEDETYSVFPGYARKEAVTQSRKPTLTKDDATIFEAHAANITPLQVAIGLIFLSIGALILYTPIFWLAGLGGMIVCGVGLWFGIVIFGERYRSISFGHDSFTYRRKTWWWKHEDTISYADIEHLSFWVTHLRPSHTGVVGGRYQIHESSYEEFMAIDEPTASSKYKCVVKTRSGHDLKISYRLFDWPDYLKILTFLNDIRKKHGADEAVFEGDTGSIDEVLDGNHDNSEPC